MYERILNMLNFNMIMNSKKVLAVLLFIVLTNMHLFAQDVSFPVLSFSGKVSFLNSGKKFSVIQSGDKIEKSGKIKYTPK